MSDLEARIAAAVARFVADHGHPPAYVVTHPDDGIECETVGGTCFCHHKFIPRDEFLLAFARNADGMFIAPYAAAPLTPDEWLTDDDGDPVWMGSSFRGRGVFNGTPVAVPGSVAEESRRFERDMDAVEPIRGKP